MSDLSHRLTTALADRYRIERELGWGGMATVFLAEDLKHHRQVAIKVLDPEVAAAIGPERFLREIETVARLTHPHILPLHDTGVADGLLFYVMPYVEGESLRIRLTREKQLPVEDALRIACEVADALSYAHSCGVVHRDVKPENILLEEGHAVVADFGIARAVAVGAEKLTATGIAVGTPAYMSPEQAAGGRDLDGRSDLYSLGCVLYEMLAGQPPFTGPTAESLAHQHLNVSPRPVTDLRPAVPAGVAAALQRALAKTPADRFNRVALFGEALGQREAEAVTPARVPAAPASRRHRARWLAPAAAVAIALVAMAAWQRWGPCEDRLGRGGHLPAARRAWILVAEFDGPPGDTTLATAARSLVSAVLDQSGIVATVPRDQIRVGLQLAGKPANTRLSSEVAREIAYRRAVRAVLEGEVGRIGSGYSIVLRVVDAESLKVVVTERATAKNDDALIPVLGRLAERLRHDLGEERGAIAATRAMSAVMTPSFEAYRLYVQAGRLFASGYFESAIPLYHQALAIDPAFAMAWFNLGLAHNNMGRLDSFRLAVVEAGRHPDRLTATQRLMIEGSLAGHDGDFERALALCSRILERAPGNTWALNQSAIILDDLGRDAEALSQLEEIERTSAFGPGPMPLTNKAEFLMSLGRLDSARAVIGRMSGPQRESELGNLELAAANWATAESLSIFRTQDLGMDTVRRVWAFGRLACAKAGRGSLRAANAALGQMAELTGQPAKPSAFGYTSALRGRLFLAAETHGAIPPPRDALEGDASTAAVLLRGTMVAQSGDASTARRLLKQARARPTSEVRLHGASLALLEARIEALAGRWENVVTLLQPSARQSAERGGAMYPAGLPAVRCLLADALEHLGRPDSAATYLERTTTDPAFLVAWNGISVPLAHHRLVVLYARMGRLADAERHLAILERWWDRPDDIAQRLLAEARSAVMSARGMVRPERAGT